MTNTHTHTHARAVRMSHHRKRYRCGQAASFLFVSVFSLTCTVNPLNSRYSPVRSRSHMIKLILLPNTSRFDADQACAERRNQRHEPWRCADSFFSSLGASGFESVKVVIRQICSASDAAREEKETTSCWRRWQKSILHVVTA